MADIKKDGRIIEARDLARELIHRMIGARKEEPLFAQRLNVADEEMSLAALLEELTDKVWIPHSGKATPQEEARLSVLLKALDQTSDEVKDMVIDLLAHAGHLHQMAGPLARESLIHYSPKAEEFNPIRQMLFKDAQRGVGRKFPTLEEAIAAINLPRFEMTFTAHPTNTNSVASMEKQRILAAEIVKVGEGGKAARRQNFITAQGALKDFATTPLPPIKNGVPTPLSVPQETDYMLSFLNDSYDDLPATYAAFDAEMAAAYPQEYRPQELKLGLKFHSWGSSGDKDGNTNVNADTTLLALSKHKAQILGRYTADLKALDLPDLRSFSEKMEAAAGAVSAISSLAHMAYEQKGHFEPEDFDTVSKNLRHADHEIELPAVIEALENQYALAPEDKKPAILTLLRRMRTFGASFGQIEYRETAEEYERVIETLIPGYDKQTEKERCATLTALLKDPETLSIRAKRLQAELAQEAGKPYNKEDPRPIAYQTLKRMELARDFPETIENNVLAECKHTSNMLEALILQHAVMKDGKRAMMGIVPLFEEHETLAQAPEIVKGALENLAYRQHIADLSLAHKGPETQQIQLAHSDNFKRAGPAPSRALLARAHERLRQMMRDFNGAFNDHVTLQFYEGGSLSDALRGGVRAMTATVNAYSMHDFTKFTVQGADLLNFFHQPATTTRLLINNLANNITGAARPERRRPNAVEDAIIDAFDTAKSDYIEQLFNNPLFREFLNRIDYGSTVEAGSFASRMIARTGAKTLEKIDSTRAIGFSETMQHADFVASWIGIKDIEKILEPILKRPEFHGLPESLALKKLYDTVPVYRDIVDKIMYGLMRSNLKTLSEVSAYSDGREHPLMEEFRKQYVGAFKLCIESYTGAQYLSFLGSDAFKPEQVKETIESGKIRDILKSQVFPHVADVLTDQERFLKLARHFEGWTRKPITKEGVEVPNLTPRERVANTLIHNMRDTVYHGIIPQITDIKYAKLYCDHSGINRPWVKENGNGHGLAA